MSTQCQFLARALLLAASTLWLSGCATPHKINNGWPNDVNSTYQAIVKTAAPLPDPNDLARLKAYYQELQNLVGVIQLEEQQIGCADCAQLTTTTPPAELKFRFFREHKNDLYVFITAWERVQASPLAHRDFTLYFNAVPPPPPFCSKPIPTCYPNSSCWATNQCDADRAKSGCQPCPP